MQNLAGGTLDRYQLVEQIGEGSGLYRAVAPDLGREVALRVGSPAEWEAQVLARLDHPGVVRALEHGESAGAPYLVLDCVLKGSLRDCALPLPAAEAAALLAPVARALAYVHAQGLIHRNVKPSNILLTSAGRPILAGFALAQPSAPAAAPTISESDLTATAESRSLVGTPEYMAPEQWNGKAEPASDGYALGVVLYELLTGQPPYVADSPVGILIKQTTQPLPSPRVAGAAVPALAEAIIFKALAKAPADRFGSLDELAAALESLATTTAMDASGTHLFPGSDASGTHLFPGMAHTSTTERPPEQPQRKRPLLYPALIAAGLVVLALIVGIGMARGRAAATADHAATTVATAATSAPEVASQPTAPAATVAPRNTVGPPTSTPSGPTRVPQATAVSAPPAVGSGVGRLPDDLQVLTASNLSHLGMIDVLSGQGMLIGWSPDSRRLALNDTSQISILDAQTFTSLQVIEQATTFAVFSPDWSLLAMTVDNQVEIWDVASAQRIQTLSGHTSEVMAMAFAPDGASLATGADREIRLWDAATGAEVERFTGHRAMVRGLVFTPDGQELVSASEDGTARLWAISSGQELRKLIGETNATNQIGDMEHLVITPDGSAIFVAQRDSSRNTILWRWSLADGAAQALSQFGMLGIECVALSPNGKVLAICPNSITGRLIDAQSGQDLSFLDLQSGGTLYSHDHLAFSPDGKLLSVSGDNGVQLWGVDGRQGDELAALNPSNAPQLRQIGAISAGFSPVDAEHDVPVRKIGGLALSPDGDRLALSVDIWAGSDSGVLVYDRATEQATLTGPEQVYAGSFTSGNPMAYSADGRWLAAAGQDGIVLRDATSLKELAAFPGDWVSVALSADGMLLAGGTDSQIQIWNIASQQPTRTINGTGIGLVFAPDGSWIAGGSETEVTLWEVASGKPLRKLAGAGLGLAVSPDGQLLAGAGEIDIQARGWGVHLWDTASGAEQRYLLLQDKYATEQGGSLAFSPDGNLLAGGSSGSLAIWDVSSGETLRATWAHAFPTEAVFVAFTPDGEQLLSAASDGVIRRWGSYSP